MDVCSVCLILIYTIYTIYICIVTQNTLLFVCLLYNQICQVTECTPEVMEDSSFTSLSVLRKCEEWQCVKQTAPLSDNTPHSTISLGHKDSPKSGEIVCRQGEEAWKEPKAGQSGNISLRDEVLEKEELGTAIRYYMFHCRALAVTVQSQTSSLRPLTV